MYAALGWLGCTALARSIRQAGVILCYHNVVAAGQQHAGVGEPGLHMPADRFREQMRWLATVYEIIPLEELLGRITTENSLRRAASITFDDAYAGVFTHALPVLRELDMPATVFVVADAAESLAPFWWDHPETQRGQTPARRAHWLTELRGDGDLILSALGAARAARLPDDYQPAGWDTLAAAVQAGITLGVHSATHRALPQLSDEELQRELVSSRAAIARHTGAEPGVFAHPYGLWDGRVREQVRAAGYRAACTLDYGLVTPGSDPWSLPRVNIPAGIGGAAFQAWAAGLSLRAVLGW